MKCTFEHNWQLGHTPPPFFRAQKILIFCWHKTFSKVKKIWTWAGRRRQNCLFWFFSSNICIWILNCSEQCQDQREEVWWWCLAWNTRLGSPNLSVYKNKYNTMLSIYISLGYIQTLFIFLHLRPIHSRQRSPIPDICHGSHGYIRVNFFWPV